MCERETPHLSRRREGVGLLGVGAWDRPVVSAARLTRVKVTRIGGVVESDCPERSVLRSRRRVTEAMGFRIRWIARSTCRTRDYLLHKLVLLQSLSSEGAIVRIDLTLTTASSGHSRKAP